MLTSAPPRASPISANAPGRFSSSIVKSFITPLLEFLIVATCCLSVLLVGMDVTIVNVALPAIQHDIKDPISGLQWVLDAYTVTIAGFLMLAGSLSDRFGRRLIFLCGIVIFTLGSLGCAAATSATAL